MRFSTLATLSAASPPFGMRASTLAMLSAASQPFSMRASAPAMLSAAPPSALPRKAFCISAAAAAVYSPTLAAIAKSRDDGYPVQQIDGRPWTDVLTSGQYFVLRQGGTEPPNSSPLVVEKRRGVYVCAGCAAPLFDSTQKFESGTGWPSFALPRAKAVETLPSLLGGAEVRCARCGGHLGDVFADGSRFVGTPAAQTGRRFCIDGAALVFVPSSADEGPVLGDGLTGRARLLPQPQRAGPISMSAATGLRAVATDALHSAWRQGSDACALRPLVEEAARDPGARAAAAAAVTDVDRWAGLWVARVEHFEKLRFTGLRVRPHYQLDSEGGIVSHIHVRWGPLACWASASGTSRPDANGGGASAALWDVAAAVAVKVAAGTAQPGVAEPAERLRPVQATSSNVVRVRFDQFWLSRDGLLPRARAPAGAGADDPSIGDVATGWLGRLLFFEALSCFPVEYADLSVGLVAFWFRPFDSCIIAERQPSGQAPTPAEP